MGARQLRRDRIRRVKCDETQPACQRCVSTGRTCDGYGIWGGGGNGYGYRTAVSSKAAPSPSTLLAPTATVSAEEQPYINWFAYRSVKKLPGTFPTAFWETLVFQASAREPAVLHSALALSAAHREETNTRGKLGSLASRNPNRHERFTLFHYNKAIKHLVADCNSESKTLIQSALIACLLLTFTEYLRGNYAAGNIHLKGGIKLLRERRSAWARPSSDRASENQVLDDAMHDPIVETFVKVQAITGLFQPDFWQLAPVLLSPGMNLSGPMFYSVKRARFALDLLLSQVFDHTARVQKERAKHGDAALTSPSLVSEQKRLRAGMASWLTAYKASRTPLRASLSPREALGYRSLHVQSFVANMMIETSLRKDEMAFDSHLPRFVAALTEWLETFTVSAPAVLRIEEALAHGDTERGSIADAGGLPLLYYVAVKCRDRRVRRQAAGLSNLIPHKEGIWDSELVARVTREVIAVEEGDYYEAGAHLEGVSDLTSPPTEEELRLPCLPSSRRLHEVRVILPENLGGKVLLTGRRTRDDGIEECIRREYNQQTECWTDAAGCN